MPTKTFYKLRELNWSIDYVSYLDQQWQSVSDIIEQLEIVKREVEDLINNIKEEWK